MCIFPQRTNFEIFLNLQRQYYHFYLCHDVQQVHLLRHWEHKSKLRIVNSWRIEFIRFWVKKAGLFKQHVNPSRLHYHGWGIHSDPNLREGKKHTKGVQFKRSETIRLLDGQFHIRFWVLFIEPVCDENFRISVKFCLSLTEWEKYHCVCHFRRGYHSLHLHSKQLIQQSINR